MCNHIHQNHLAFVESIKNKIRLATLAEFKNDVQEFLRFLKNNLRLNTSTGADTADHIYLIPHILHQLRTTTIPVFQQSMLTWQREYMENKLRLTPSSLDTMADDECQVLKHANQWVETIDPSVVAMQALLHTNKEGSANIFKSLAANLSEIVKKQQDMNRDFKNNRDERYRMNWTNQNNNPEWIFTPPDDILQTRYFNSRTWYFCTKCSRNGRWVVTHSVETHWPHGPDHFTERKSFYQPRAHGNNNNFSRYTNTDHRGYEWHHYGDNTSRHIRDGYSGRSCSRSP